MTLQFPCLRKVPIVFTVPLPTLPTLRLPDLEVCFRGAFRVVRAVRSVGALVREEVKLDAATETL